MSEEKKGGFSYESPEKQKKRAFSLFIIESGLIVVVIIGAFIALNYFGIFPLSRLFPNLFGGLPQNNEIIKKVNKIFVDPNQPAVQPSVTPVKYDKNAKPSIEVVSDIKGYDISIQNNDQLMQLMKSWNVFENEYSTTYGSHGSTGGYPLKKIVVHLTDKEQKANIQAKDLNNIYAGSLTEITPGTFSILIYLEPKSILTGKVATMNPDKTFTVIFLQSIYRIVNSKKITNNSEAVMNQFYNSFKTNSLMNNIYFKIVRK